MLDLVYSTDKSKALEQFNKITRENEGLVKNYCQFLSWWLSYGSYKVDPQQLTREIINTRGIKKDLYSLICWDIYHYAKEGYQVKDLDNYFTVANRWELKRGLGLCLEHSIVAFNKNSFLPCYNIRGSGQYSYDFIYHTNELYYPVDLKLCFGSLPSFQRNTSIFNLNVLMTEADIVEILESIRDRDNTKYKRVIERLTNAIIEAESKKKYILLNNSTENKKSFKDWRSLKLQAVF